MGVVLRRLDAGTESLDVGVERREQLTDDLEVDGLEAMKSGVLENPFAPDIHRQHLSVCIEEGLGFDNDDLLEVIRADSGSQESCDAIMKKREFSDSKPHRGKGATTTANLPPQITAHPSILDDRAVPSLGTSSIIVSLAVSRRWIRRPS